MDVADQKKDQEQAREVSHGNHPKGALMYSRVCFALLQQNLGQKIVSSMKFDVLSVKTGTSAVRQQVFPIQSPLGCVQSFMDFSSSISIGRSRVRQK